MELCDLIASNIEACTDKTSLGFKNTAKIGNIAELGTVTYDDSTALISDLSMAANKHCYEVYQRGENPFGEFKITGEGKKLGMTFKNEIPIYIKGLSPTTVGQFNKLTKGEFFIGLEQKGVTGSAKYLFIGLQAALHCSAAEWDSAEGAFKIMLTEDMLDNAVLFLWTGTAGDTTEATWAALTV